MANSLMDADRQINWVWFRDKGYRLPNKIMTRAASWIELNPEFKCNLWTDMENESDMIDFISNLNQEYQNYFLTGRITVKYFNDTKGIFYQFCEKNEMRIDPRMMAMWDELFNNRFKISRLFKTDGFRSIMLNVVGGIYCDFNDTVCFFPMKYLLPLYSEYFMGGDLGPNNPDHRNNYFMYCPKGDQGYLDTTLEILQASVNEYYRIKSDSFVRLYMNMCQEMIHKVNNYDGQYVLGLFVELDNVKEIMNDEKKDFIRLISIMVKMLRYFKVNDLADRCEYELIDLLDTAVHDR